MYPMWLLIYYTHIYTYTVIYVLKLVFAPDTFPNPC